MKTLLLIGNGFDLGHGLPTRFDDFIDSNPYLRACIHNRQYNPIAIERELMENGVEKKDLLFQKYKP